MTVIFPFVSKKTPYIKLEYISTDQACMESDQYPQLTSNNGTNLVVTVSLNSRWNLADSFWSRVV